MRTCRRLSLALAVALTLLGPLPALAAGPFQFYTLAPCRVIDTRLPANAPALAHNTTRDFTARGTCGISPTAAAVALNVTAVTPTSQGHLRLFPTDTALPNISTINFAAGIVALANGAIVPLAAVLGSPPDFSVYTFLATGSGSVHLVIDVVGFYQ